MKEKNSSKLIFGVIISLLILALIVSVYFNFKYYTLYKAKENDALKSNENSVSFLNDYIIAISDYNKADGRLELAMLNFEYASEYVLTEEYYYVSAEGLFDNVLKYLDEAEKSIVICERKLYDMENKSSSEFINKDISNRQKQAEVLKSVIILYKEMVKLYKDSLYEINYGSEVKSEEKLKEYNSKIPEFNNKLKELSDISNEIDLEWDKDWFLEFEPAVTGSVIANK